MRVHPASDFAVKNGIVLVDDVTKLIMRNAHCGSAFLDTEAYKQGVAQGLLPSFRVANAEELGALDASLRARLERAQLPNYVVEYVSFVTRPDEWCALQLIEALRAVVALQSLLLADDYHLRYPHVFNVTLTSRGMQYIDVGDIRNGVQPNVQILLGGIVDALEDPLLNLATRLTNVKEMLSRMKSTLRATREPLKACTLFSECLEAMRPVHAHGSWSDYKGAPTLPTRETLLALRSMQHAKSESVYDVLVEKRPSSVVDLGCHLGFYTHVAALNGARAIGVDLCEDVIAAAHTHNKALSHDCRFVVGNLLKKPTALGKEGSYETMDKRLKADGVIVAAVTHHLYRAGMDWSAQAQRLAPFAREWLLVEFIPSTDQHIRGWGLGGAYNEAAFSEAFLQHFSSARELPSYPSPRKWFLFSK